MAHTERRTTGVWGPTRSTSRRLRSPRCSSRVHARRQLCRSPRAALAPVNRFTASLSSWPPMVCGSAPPQPFPGPGRVTCPRGGPQATCPAPPMCRAGPALSLLLRGDSDPAEQGQDWSFHLVARAGLCLFQSLCLELLDHLCLRTYNESRGSQP